MNRFAPRQPWPRALATAVVAGCLAIVAAGNALGEGTSTRATITGSPSAGKSTFVSTCGVCHTLKAAGTLGNLGPNLTTAAAGLTEKTIIDAITNGGASVMTKAAAARYTTQMVAYKGTLTPAQIDNVAAYVYTSTHAATATGKPSITAFTPTSGKAGAKVTVTGENLRGVTTVKLGTVKAAFKVSSATKLTLTVPSKAKTGTISATSKAGTATSSKSFTVK
jgi:mono/diheme cytochrome c family protein